MIRRRTVLATVVAATAAALLVPGTATAGPGRSDFSHSHNVCSAPRDGEAACIAEEVDDAVSLKPLATTSYVNGYTPAQLRSAYGPFGTNTMTIAIVDAYASPNAAADLAVYRTQFGLGPANLTQVNQNGGPITTVTANVGWGQEEMLDLEMASAICPQCALIYVGANSASFTDLSAAVTRAKLMGAKVISNSYGASEFRGETTQTAWNIPGVAVTVSSGDSGYGASYPAAAAGVIAVGGTSLKLDANGNRLSETVWTGAGSGCSAYIAKPSWQRDSGCSRRTIADVSAVADPATGVAVYSSYGSTGGANWFVFGGTSVSAPIIAGIFAQGADFGPTEQVAKRLYTNASSLYDVVSGSNGTCTSRKSTALAYLCTGLAGYDGPTGNGTPKGLTAPF